MEDKLNASWNSITKYGWISSFSDADKLRQNYNIICDPIGTSITSRRQNKILIKPFILNKYDLFYLHNKALVNITSNIEDFTIEYEKTKNDTKYRIYADLKAKDYYLINGFKYGVDFLAYKDDPNYVHSDYLIYCSTTGEIVDVDTIISLERISVSTRKKLWIAFYENDTGEVKYINTSWLQI